MISFQDFWTIFPTDRKRQDLDLRLKSLKVDDLEGASFRCGEQQKFAFKILQINFS